MESSMQLYTRVNLTFGHENSTCYIKNFRNLCIQKK